MPSLQLTTPTGVVAYRRRLLFRLQLGWGFWAAVLFTVTLLLFVGYVNHLSPHTVSARTTACPPPFSGHQSGSGSVSLWRMFISGYSPCC